VFLIYAARVVDASSRVPLTCLNDKGGVRGRPFPSVRPRAAQLQLVARA
jgi:hypothetical protein